MKKGDDIESTKSEGTSTVIDIWLYDMFSIENVRINIYINSRNPSTINKSNNLLLKIVDG